MNKKIQPSIDEQIIDLKKKLESIPNSPTINLFHAEGIGQSSCELNRTSKSMNYTIKVYSSDLTGATLAVSEALRQALKVLEPQIKVFNGVDKQ